MRKTESITPTSKREVILFIGRALRLPQLLRFPPFSKVIVEPDLTRALSHFFQYRISRVLVDPSAFGAASAYETPRRGRRHRR